MGHTSNKKLMVPEAWEEISVNTYIDIISIPTKDEEGKKRGDYDYLTSIIACITRGVEKEDILKMDVSSLKNVIEAIHWVFTPPEATKDVGSVIIGGKEYYPHKEFAKLTVGEMISIEQAISLDELNNITAIPDVLAVLLRQKDSDGNLKDFDPDEYPKIKEAVKDMPITDALGITSFFLPSAKSFTKGLKAFSKVNQKKKMRKKWWNPMK